MRLAVLVDAGAAAPYSLDALAGGPSAYDRVLSYAASLPGLAGCMVLGGRLPLPEGPFPVVTRDSWDAEAVLAEAMALCASLEASGPLDALVLVRGDEALLDRELSLRMLGNFERYRAEYSFADGYPLGLAPEILRPRVLPALRELARREPRPAARGWLFAVIQKDINSFDIETEISPRDLRDLRLDLRAASRHELLILERLMAAGVGDSASALAVIPGRLDLLRGLPAFVQVQVSGGCPQACASCPWPRIGGDILSRRDSMPLPRFASLMEGLSLFAGEATVDLSLWGEPALHPAIEGLVGEVLSRPGLSLIVETSGIGWEPGILERLAARPDASRISWVVSLDAAERALYEKLRGPGFDEAVATAEALLALFPAGAYVQTLRTAANEDDLESFWRGWRKKTERVIVQKYSTFAGFLEGRAVSDLSPLERRPCWHQKRDLAILLDGTVPLCRDCARNEIVLGSLFEGGEADGAAMAGRLAAVWAAGEPWHAAHVEASGGRGAWPAPCAVCDEYYTFNA